ncbi:MAG: hypothetical protein U9R79_05785 [Armatimonadota bacterium]|nr:hypothetical protein [Armatimonadota bacterium]
MSRLWPALMVVLVAAASCGAQPVFRADFESEGEAPSGWRFAQVRGECSGAWDHSEPAGGSSIRCDIPEDASARASWICTKRIELQPDTAYRLRLRVMLGDISEGAKGAYVILYEDGVEAPDHWHMTPFMRDSQDWHDRELTFVTRPDTTWARLQCKLWECTGHAWFDDIVIERIPREEAQAEPSALLHLPQDDGWPLQLIVYPAQRRVDRTVCLLRGRLNPMAVFFYGRSDEVADPHLIVEAPEEVTLRGPVVCGRQPPPEPVDLEPEAVERDGGTFLRWRLPIPQDTLVRGLSPEGPRWSRYHFIYARPGPGCPDEFTWRWRIENAGEPGPEHSMSARAVENLGPNLGPIEGFDLYAQHSSALRLPTAEGRQEVLDYLHYAGIRGGLALSYYQPELLPIDEELGERGWFTWSWAWYGYGGPTEEGQEIVFDREDARRRGDVCPQVQVEMLEPYAPWLREFYAKPLALDRDWIIINYEPPVFNVCFCERCRRAFAEFAGLEVAEVLGMTPQEIQGLPDHAWGRFRAWQNERIIENHCAVIHEIDPDILVGICGPGRTEWTANRGMDIARFEPDVGLHAPMLYLDPVQYEWIVRETCEATSAPVIPFMLGSDLAVKGVFPTAWDQHTNMLATALSGGRGAILWVGIESLDGEIMNALRRSMEQIQVLEPYILGAERGAGATIEPELRETRTVTVNGQEIQVSPENSRTPVRSWQWRGAQGRLIGLINYDREQPHAVRISAEGIEGARALFGPEPQRANGAATLELAPGEFAAVAW